MSRRNARRGARLIVALSAVAVFGAPVGVATAGDVSAWVIDAAAIITGLSNGGVRVVAGAGAAAAGGAAAVATGDHAAAAVAVASDGHCDADAVGDHTTVIIGDGHCEARAVSGQAATAAAATSR